MTKRLISFSIVLVLLFINSAYADTTRMKGNFTIRNGIAYRMSRENIVAAEKAYGTTQEAKNTTFLVLDNDAPEGYTDVDIVRFNRMTLLGEEHDHCSLIYFLDKNERLTGMHYSINTGDYDKYNYPRTDAQSDYSRLKSDLIAKYGQPIGNVANGKGSLLAAHTYSYLAASTLVTYTASNCTQWLVQYDDCYCIVELFIRDGSSMQQILDHVGGVYLSYRLVTAEELNELMQEAQQQQNEQYRDI